MGPSINSIYFKGGYMKQFRLYLILTKNGQGCGTLDVSDYTKEGLRRVSAHYEEQGFTIEMIGGK